MCGPHLGPPSCDWKRSTSAFVPRLHWAPGSATGLSGLAIAFCEICCARYVCWTWFLWPAWQERFPRHSAGRPIPEPVRNARQRRPSRLPWRMASRRSGSQLRSPRRADCSRPRRVSTVVSRAADRVASAATRCAPSCAIRLARADLKPRQHSGPKEEMISQSHDYHHAESQNRTPHPQQ